MNAQPQVSVVVPVYNAGCHLQPCLQSLAAQTLKEIEFVLVLDCPTDGSDAVAEAFAARDPRFRIVRNAQNLNIGLSRNAGIEAARGRWIGFADHDDLVEPDLWERLLQTALQQQADVVLCDFDERGPAGTGVYALPQYAGERLRMQVLQALIAGRYAKAGTVSMSNVNSVWTELVSRDLIDRYGLRFPDNRICSYEDALFNVGVFAHASKAAYLSQVLYHHMLHDANAFSRYDYRAPGHVLCHVRLLEQQLEDCGLRGRFDNDLRACLVRRLYTSMHNELKFKGLRSLPAFFTTVAQNETAARLLGRGRIDGLRLTQRLFLWCLRLRMSF